MKDPTPLLDCFRRGEAARDVRMLAAEGALAPRAYEQAAILVLLLEDADPEIRRAADETLCRIPVERLGRFLAQSHVPVELRDRFAARGIVPLDAIDPAVDLSVDLDGPLIDTAESAPESRSADDDPRRSLVHGISQMSFTDRLKAAIKGTREMRAVLIRDTNKTVAAAVLSCPKLTESEIEAFARMANVGEDVLRVIGGNRAWTRHYGVVVGLTRNPKTPVAVALNLMPRLNARDLLTLSVDRNVPEAVRKGARKKLTTGVARG
ncbi:MAG: hypothetical protein ABJA98_30755 [Acidobacteriota bacterium]